MSVAAINVDPMSVTVNVRMGAMGRWQPDSRGRLQEAALALYSERGFDQTTAAQIAARAGVTERTFFRHFADKREVLFGGSALLQERIVAGVAGAPADDGPLDAVSRGLDAAATVLVEFRRDLSALRQAVIAANRELRERELAKLADYADAVADALRQRGVSEPQATLTAEAGMAVLRVAIKQWAGEDDGRDLATIMRDSIAELRSVTALGDKTSQPPG
jgi:AcrR family transcriptional regulator